MENEEGTGVRGGKRRRRKRVLAEKMKEIIRYERSEWAQKRGGRITSWGVGELSEERYAS